MDLEMKNKITDGLIIFEFPMQFTRFDKQPDNSFFPQLQKGTIEL